MRSFCLLLTIGLLASCSVGNDFSRTTFQKKRYSRGYYVHKAKDRSVPDSPDDPTAAQSESQDKPAPSTMEVVPPGETHNTEPTPIQSSRRERAQPRPLSVLIPAREVAGMAHKERSLLLLEPQDNEEQSERKPVHWTTIANLITLIGGMVGSLFNSPWVQLGLAAPLFAAISFAFAGPRRRHSGIGVAILTFLLFFITVIALESRGAGFVDGFITVLAGLMLLVCWLAYALADRFAPDPAAEPEAFHGVDMEADPEPELKWHRTTWISLAMIATSLALMVSGASGLFLLSLPALAWFPATYALLKSNAERSHSGRG
ncbi:MAG: hypothetical protein L7S67_09095, partial [Flavobacteriales bacterium]|nr:hypothetical protein [Flavobacteriales bacterium]